MAGEGLRQMKRSFLNIINEIGDHREEDENVAVLCFGQEVKFLHYLSNNYESIRRSIDGIECRGSSPLEAGILLSTSCFLQKRVIVHFNAFLGNTAPSRLIVITDGSPTDPADINRPEPSVAFVNPFSTFITRLRATVAAIGIHSSVLFIPVGSDPNMNFLKLVTDTTKRVKGIQHCDSQQVGRFSKNMSIAIRLLKHKSPGQVTVSDIKSSAADVTQTDIEEISELIQIGDKTYSNTSAESDNDEMFVERYSDMPSIGSRVKRGPDWQWGDQDGMGPGTLVGHSRVGWLFIEWDDGRTCKYRYGFDGKIAKYDLIECDDPRILSCHQQIATGCLVSRGPDWKWDNQDGGEENIGTVYRVKQTTPVVYVKWPHGVKSNYRFGYQNKFDVRVRDPLNPAVIERMCFQRSAYFKKYNQREQNQQAPNQSSMATVEVHDRDSLTNCKRQWQWRDPTGRWIDYSDEINEKIETCYSRNRDSTVIIQFKGHLCRIILRQRKHVDTITKLTTDVRVCT